MESPIRERAFYWMGPALGASSTLLWQEPTLFWLGLGAVLGYASELAAARISSAEETEGDRAIAFFFVLQTLLTLLPFLAAGGLLPRAPSTDPATLTRLGLIPAGAALAAAFRYLRRASHSGALTERRRRIALAAPDARRWLAILGAFSLAVAVGWADYHLPAPYSLDFLYLLPVFAVTWTTGAWGGVVLAIFSAEVHGIARGLSYADQLTGGLASVESLLIASGLAAEALLLATIRSGLERERRAARTDVLTGLLNRPAFLARVESELRRAGSAEPVSLVYLDLDGFKAVNDQRGHAAGDEVLRIVAGVLRTSLRTGDVTARLGGDEFAVLMPETDGEDAMRMIERVRREVEDRMHAFGWAVTCSIGVVTSSAAASTVDELIHAADGLMYQVKRGGKNALRHAVLASR